MTSFGSDDELKVEINRLRATADHLTLLLSQSRQPPSIADAPWYVSNLAECQKLGISWLPDWPHACAKPPFAFDDDVRLSVTAELLQLSTDEHLNKLCSLARTSFKAAFTCVDLISRHSVNVVARDLQYPPLERLTEAPRELTYCNWVVVKNDVLVIPDLSRDKAAEKHFICTDYGIKFWAGAPLRTSTGVVIGTLCLMDDKPRSDFDETQSALLQLFASSAANSLEVSLLRKKKDAFRQHVLHTMSHELRTPIHSIMSDCETLTTSASLQEQQQAITEISDQSTVMLSIVNDMLDVLRLEGKQLIKDRTRFLLEDVVSKLSRAFRQHVVDFVVDTQYKGQSCLGDGHKIHQILNILLSNAAKACGKGSRIRVEIDFYLDSTTLSPATSRFHHYAPAKIVSTTESSMYIRVIDRGVGISKERLPELFDPDRGSGGLGLILCVGLISLLNGQVMVESLIGAGSIFHALIPLEICPTPESPSHTIRSTSAPQQHQSERQGKPLTRVVVVDDHEVNLKVARRLLRDGPFTVDCVDSAAQCLELLRGTEDVDVVLMDVQMPQMDGIECTTLIRAMNKPRSDAIVIAATASAADVRGLECFDEVIEKPFSKDLLLRTIARHLRRRRFQKQLNATQPVIERRKTASDLSHTTDSTPVLSLLK